MGIMMMPNLSRKFDGKYESACGNKRIYQITKQQRQDCIYSGNIPSNACNGVGNIEARAEATQCIIQLGQP
ncbi:unnamed protein product [Lasius platythorax]|uniref:Uncharacterized protein n=1 Tax=Lasius platythorax TaxID=488582 RepID=A0AAV2NTW4_9HYME